MRSVVRTWNSADSSHARFIPANTRMTGYPSGISEDRRRPGIPKEHSHPNEGESLMPYVTLRRRAAATFAATALAAISFAGSASAAVAPGGNAPPPYAPTASSNTTQGIIMKDGNICDPIRHMGC